MVLRVRHLLAPALAAMAAATVLVASGCGGTPVPADPAVVVGSKGFTESRVVAAAYAQALRRLGFTPTVRNLGDTATLAAATRRGAVDLYPEYTGSAWVAIEHGEPTALAGKAPSQQEAMVRARLADDPTLHAFAPAPASNNAVAACTRESGLTSLADATGLSTHARLAATSESLTRPDSVPYVARAYGFRIRNPIVTPSDQRYGPIRSGRANCVVAYATDPEIKELGLVVLADPKRVVAGGIDYRLIPIASAAWWDSLDDDMQAQVDEALSNVSHKMTTAWLRAANLRVVRGEAPEDVALELVNVTVPEGAAAGS